MSSSSQPHSSSDLKPDLTAATNWEALAAGERGEPYKHPKADPDSKAICTGWAAYAPGQALKPYSYHAHRLDSGWVEVATQFCGICGTDLHVMDSEWRPSNYPVIVGHEIVGRILAVGSDVSNLHVGDRVGIGAQCGACLNRYASSGKECEECASGEDNHCRIARVGTYNTKREDGMVTQGGYADRIRCEADFVFRIPDAIESVHAAPLMCAGSTVYSPLKRAMTREGMKIGIIGIGGLGHLGVLFARKLADGSAHVTAISHNDRRRSQALELGAHEFLDTSDKAAVNAAQRRFDFLLCTANGSDIDMSVWLSLLKVGGTLCSVGIPPQGFSVHAFSLFANRSTLTASLVANRAEIREMLDFVAKHHIKPVIERMDMADANVGIQRMREGKARFRIVLENKNFNKS